MAIRTHTVKAWGHEWEVDIDYQPSCRGAREALTGMQLEPDEDEGFELESACLVGYTEGEDTTPIDVLELLSEGTRIGIEEAIWQQVIHVEPDDC